MIRFQLESSGDCMISNRIRLGIGDPGQKEGHPGLGLMESHIGGTSIRGTSHGDWGFLCLIMNPQSTITNPPSPIPIPHTPFPIPLSFLGIGIYFTFKK